MGLNGCIIRPSTGQPDHGVNASPPMTERLREGGLDALRRNRQTDGMNLDKFKWVCYHPIREGDNMSNQKGNEPMRKQQSVRFESEANEWLKMQSERQRRSISEIIRMIVDDAMKNKWGE